MHTTQIAQPSVNLAHPIPTSLSLPGWLTVAGACFVIMGGVGLASLCFTVLLKGFLWLTYLPALSSCAGMVVSGLVLFSVANVLQLVKKNEFNSRRG
ncbi:MAG: hypothetical protein QM680_11490 [Luteolibacter sp.]